MQPDRADPTAAFEGQLDAGQRAMGLNLDAATVQRLLEYQALIQKWNRVYNLTAIREPRQMLVQHLLDSLAIVVPLRERFGRGIHRAPGALPGQAPDQSAGQPAGPSTAPRHGRPAAAPSNPPPALLAVDVGSGAGLPGIPLALAWPQLHVTMVEPVGKKAAFIQHAIGALGLTNAASAACRVEQLKQSPTLKSGGPGGRLSPLATREPDLIVSRAFASLADFAQSVEAIAGAHTQVAAMKGVLPLDEIHDLPPGWVVSESIPLTVPGLDAQRHLILFSRSA